MQMQYDRDPMEEIEEHRNQELLDLQAAVERQRQLAAAITGAVVEEGWGKGMPELHGMRISLPESQSVLRIGPDGPDVEVMRIESPHPYPGPIRRLAYWVVLGWKWERPK